MVSQRRLGKQRRRGFGRHNGSSNVLQKHKMILVFHKAQVVDFPSSFVESWGQYIPMQSLAYDGQGHFCLKLLKEATSFCKFSMAYAVGPSVNLL